MKVSISKRGLVIAGVAVVVVLTALAVGRSGEEDAGGGPLDAPATQACTDFADGYPQAHTTAERLALADEVSKSSAGTDNEVIADRILAVGRNANDSKADWKSAAAALTQACRDAGWS